MTGSGASVRRHPPEIRSQQILWKLFKSLDDDLSKLQSIEDHMTDGCRSYQR